MEEFQYEQIRNILTVKNVVWVEKKMMGGKTFMIDDKMCFGSFREGLLCRVDPEERDALLEKEGTEIMIQRGREMKGYVYLHPTAFDTDLELAFWIGKCLEFNPKAKSSRKRKK